MPLIDLCQQIQDAELQLATLRAEARKRLSSPNGAARPKPKKRPLTPPGRGKSGRYIRDAILEELRDAGEALSSLQLRRRLGLPANFNMHRHAAHLLAAGEVARVGRGPRVAYVIPRSKR